MRILFLTVAGLLALSDALVAQPAKTGSGQSSHGQGACDPIGRTEDGKLIYSLKCEHIPKTSIENSPAASVSERRSLLGGGFFGMSSREPGRGEARGPAVPPNPN